MTNFQEFSEEDSGTEDDAELESYLYSQIHYSQEEEVDIGPDSSRGCEIQSNSIIESEKKASSNHNTSKSFSNSSITCVKYQELNSNSAKDDSKSKDKEGNSTNLQRVPDNTPSIVNSHSAPTDHVVPTQIDTKEPQRIVRNPLYSDSDSDSSSDDGIIVVSGGEKETITISSDESEEKKTFSVKHKSSARLESRARKRKRNEHYVAEFGSDFEDNFLSEDSLESSDTDTDSSVMLVEEDKMQINITKSASTPVLPEFSDPEDGGDWNTPRKWNMEMNRFYCSYNKENLNLSLESLHGKASSCSWQVDRADLMKGGRFQSRYFTSKGKCNNCNEMGHFARECKEPAKPVKCFMCGTPGHRDVRCPENCCLGCGQPGLGFQSSCSHCRSLQDTQCRECGFVGHLRRNCPDLWRRFHQTTEEGLNPVAHDSSKESKKHWCPNCGRKGHLIQDCRRYLYSPHPVTSLKVVNYKAEANTWDDDIPRKRKRDKMDTGYDRRRSSTCPNSPSREPIFDRKKVQSEPVTPVGQNKPISKFDLLRAVENISKKDKFKQKRREKRELAKKNKTAQRRWDIDREAAFQNRIANGQSKREKKRQKFYNAVQRQEFSSVGLAQRRFKGQPSARQEKYVTGKKKKRSEGRKEKDVHLPKFFKMKFHA